MLPVLPKDLKQSRILIVDDEPINLMALSEQLDIYGYSNITSISNPFDAISAYESNDFDLVMLDINMPVLDGFDVMERFAEINKDLPPPVLVLTAQTDRVTRQRALKGGARDFLLKPYDDDEVESRVCNLLEMHLSQKIILNYSSYLEETVKQRTQALLDTQLEIVQRLGFAAEYRDTETADHTLRVGSYSRVLGEEMGLSGERLINLHHAAPMHDIGKIGIADSILLKPGRFTPEERLEMEKHSAIGAEILKGETSELLKMARKIAHFHHERWDGTGYPTKISGDNIPLCARIVAVADVFDALTMSRPYKDGWPIDKAVAYIIDNSGAMFDPKVVTAFQARLDEIVSIKMN